MSDANSVTPSWTLCSDKPPPNNKEVLVTYYLGDNTKKRYVQTASCVNDADGIAYWSSVWDEYRVSNVKETIIAWMPMPAPYKGDI